MTLYRSIPVILLAAVSAIAGPRPDAKLLEGMTRYGCDVRPAQLGSYLKLSSYQSNAWIEHRGVRDWEFTLSVRQGSRARRKALLDCDEFMTAVEKAVQKRKP